jgi:hypothetical protein
MDGRIDAAPDRETCRALSVSDIPLELWPPLYYSPMPLAKRGLR